MVPAFISRCRDASLARQLGRPGAGDRTGEVVRAIWTVTGLSLWNSERLLDSAPVAVTEPNRLEVADEAASILGDAGARATVLCDWCDRTITRGATLSTRPRARGHGLPRHAGRVGHRPRFE
ncbi:ribosomal protein L7/L12 [Streptomyces goshikiensis]|uniref:ribosomal protein L7/L12 n=1 Tax=Streptomyces goshikiensis TaxID=1942 RepID=UPI00371BB4C0